MTTRKTAPKTTRQASGDTGAADTSPPPGDATKPKTAGGDAAETAAKPTTTADDANGSVTLTMGGQSRVRVASRVAESLQRAGWKRV